MLKAWTKKRIRKLGYRVIYEDLRRIHYERTESHMRVYHAVLLEYNKTDNEVRVKSYNEVTGANIALDKKEYRLFRRMARYKRREYAIAKWGY